MVKKPHLLSLLNNETNPERCIICFILRRMPLQESMIQRHIRTLDTIHLFQGQSWRPDI